MSRTYRGTRGVGWGSIFPLTKREKRKIDDTHNYIDHLLEKHGGAYVMGTYMEVVPVKDLFTEIRDALIGVEPIVKLRFSSLYYQVGKSFDQQTCATLSDLDGKMIISLTVNRRDDGVETRFIRYGSQTGPTESRTTTEHGEDVVRSSVVNFIREVLS